jgi:hypothetical protein
VPPTIKISDSIPPDKRSELLAALSGRVPDGLTVTVTVDVSGLFATATVWRIVVDGHGYHASSRLEKDATAAEWAAAIQALAPPTP